MKQATAPRDYPQTSKQAEHRTSFAARLRGDKWLYLLLPGLLYFLVLNTYRCGGHAGISKLSAVYRIFQSEWVGFEHFRLFLTILSFLCCCAIRCCYRSIISSSFSCSDYISTLVKRSKAFVLQTHDSNDDLRSAFYIDGHRGKPDVRVPNHGRGAVNELLFQYTGNKIQLLSDPSWFRP